MKRHTAPTPKVFNANYQPPRADSSQKKLPRPLLLSGVLIVGFFLLARLPVFRISSVEISGIDSPVVGTELSELKGQSIFSSAIARVVARSVASHPELQEIHCVKGLPSTLRCQATPRLAQLRWRNGSGEFLMDSQGYLYAGSNGELPLVVDKAGSGAEAGQVASEEIVAAYSDIYSQLTAAGFAVSELDVGEALYQVTAVTTARADSLPFPPVATLNILYSTSYPVSSQTKVAEKLLGERADQIKERIDVRVPGFVYYF